MDFVKVREEVQYGPKATYILLGINLIIFLIASFLKIFFGFSSLDVAELLGGSSLYFILNGQFWRFLLSCFVHLDILHLVLNMSALYYYGRFIERFYSTKKILIIYTLSGISGTVFALLNINTIVIGASGAIWGFIGVMVGNSVRSNTYSPGLPIDIKSILPGTMTWLVIGFMLPGVSGLGHLGGFIGGFILGLIFDTVNTFRQSQLEQTLTKILYIVSLVIFALSFLGLFAFWLL